MDGVRREKPYQALRAQMSPAAQRAAEAKAAEYHRGIARGKQAVMEVWLLPRIEAAYYAARGAAPEAIPVLFVDKA